ncbi:putative MYND domain protein [Mycena indigotica]|uniref:Putative MYND domain protein n=1 Tax=Mycena indigotica TaxID=2126181 RepID=A0A8H6T994_9AGAR|nr:putative MYND domain protein [Mycena indigotica]KAF7311695.1 putative MYND domain protein [Mycena indigotica]
MAAIVARLRHKPWDDFTDLEKHIWSEIQANHPAQNAPDKNLDIVAWNNYYELVITLKYHPYREGRPMPQVPCNDILIKATSVRTVSETNQRLKQHNQELFNAELLLLESSIEIYRLGFVDSWTALERTAKETIVMEGLYRASCYVVRTCAESRSGCPEMTVSGLAGDGKYNLISLMNAFLSVDPEGTGKLKELYFFEHPYGDNEYRTAAHAPDGLKLGCQQLKVFRNMYIVWALIFIFKTHLGHPREEFPRTRNAVHRSAEEKQRMKQVNASLKRDGYYLLTKEEERETRRENAKADARCTACHTISTQSSLKRCSRCGHVWYCSVQCQKRDWKTHKRSCGLEHFDLAAVSPVAPAPIEFIGCPPAAPGFVRSLTLRRQIAQLANDCYFGAAYLCDVQADGATFISRPIFLAHSTIDAKVQFFVARRRAMATGSPAAVAKMMTVLHQAQRDEGLDVPFDTVIAQFVREYEIAPWAGWEQVAEAARDFPPPTQEEKIEEQKYRIERMLRVLNLT